MTADLTVRCGCFIDGTGRPPLHDVEFTVTDGTVAEVGQGNRLENSAAKVIDASDCTVTPGLIDGHAHIAWPNNPESQWGFGIDDVALTALAVAAGGAALTSGVTSIRDCGAPRGITIQLKSAYAMGWAVGPRLYVCGPAITTTGGHGTWLGVTADTSDQLRVTVRDLCASGVDFIKIMATGGFTDPFETNRRRAQYSEDELRTVTAEAHRLNRAVVAHANATEGIRNAVRASVDCIAHCNWLSSQDGLIEYDQSVATLMAAQGTYIDLNLESAMADVTERDGTVTGFPGDVLPHDRWGLLADLRSQGVDVYLTSDLAGARVADFPSLLGRAGRAWNLPAEELIWRASGLSAKAMGVAASCGTLGIGKVADFLVWEGDLSADISILGSKPISVYQGGGLVAENGRLAV